MVWQIIDERSNLLGEFTDEPSALAAVREMIDDESGVTDSIALVAYDDANSNRAHRTLTGAALLTAAREQGQVGGPQAA